MAGTVDIDPLHAAEQGVITDSASPEEPNGEMDGAAASQAWDEQQADQAEPTSVYGDEHDEGQFVASNAPGEPDDPSTTVPRNPYTQLPGDPNAGLPEQKDPPPWYGVTVDVGAVLSTMSPATQAQLLTRSIFALQRRLALQPGQLPPALQYTWSQFVTGWAALCRPLTGLPALTRIRYWDQPTIALTTQRFLARFRLLCAAIRAYLPPLAAADDDTAIGGLKNWLFDTDLGQDAGQRAQQLTNAILAINKILDQESSKLTPTLKQEWEGFVKQWAAFCANISRNDIPWYNLPGTALATLKAMWGSKATYNAVIDYENQFSQLDDAIATQLGHQTLTVKLPKPPKKLALDTGDGDKKGGWGFWGTAAMIGLGGLGIWFLWDAVTARGRTYGRAFQSARGSFQAETDPGPPIFAREITRPRAISRGHQLAPGY